MCMLDNIFKHYCGPSYCALPARSDAVQVAPWVIFVFGLPLPSVRISIIVCEKSIVNVVLDFIGGSGVVVG